MFLAVSDPKKLEKEPFEKRLLSQRDYFSNKLFLEVSGPKKLKNGCFEKRARVQLLLAPLNPYFGGLGRIFGMTSRDVAINHPDDVYFSLGTTAYSRHLRP